MNTSASQRRLELANIPFAVWLGLGLLATAFSYLCILPLFRPRGDFLWGYYRLKDVYLGIPVGLAALCALLVLVAPARHKRPLALRLTLISVAFMTTLFFCDAVFALGVMGAWRANFWLDQAHIARRYSIADAELGFVRKPGVSWRGYVPDVDRIVDYRTDKNGFRNSSSMRSANVVFLGDSLTEAAQVAEHDTFVRRVGAASGLSVVNLGRGAYGPQQELIVLQRYGLAYRPRVVVWQLFEGNDLADARVFAEWKKDPQQGGTSLKERYFANSLLAEWIPRARRRQSTLPAVKLQHCDGTESRMTLRYEYDPDAPAKNPLGFAATTQAIEAGYRLCQSQGVKLVVVFVPTMVRVMEPHVTFDLAEDRIHHSPNNVGSEKNDFSGRMAEFCGKLGCPFIDTFTALRQAATIDNRNLYIPVDEHLDIRGHEVVAQTVGEWLRSQATISQKMK